MLIETTLEQVAWAFCYFYGKSNPDIAKPVIQGLLTAAQNNIQPTADEHNAIANEQVRLWDRLRLDTKSGREVFIIAAKRWLNGEK